MSQEILYRPVLTEKMTALGDTHRQYAFEVDSRANKIDIARVIAKKYNVKIDSIRTIRVKGKKKKQMTRRGVLEGKRPLVKKAIITIADGQKIDFFGTEAK